ncbi:hypothetical protein CDD82_3952 [Ophiocordyceps australis]|uniref:Uncharacterized protein n=1 Tax=Ophiocordyceps australis TaxID=1399860 RepID=A0A2C5YEL7_9HYPO|nr:hypothetical protein CDD82_3952 [Ophiocordyceps australis]
MPVIKIRKPRKREYHVPIDPKYRKKRPAEFWDELDPPPLSHVVLREFNDRTLEKRIELLKPKRNARRERIDPSRRQSLLLRFSRHGGPDLSFLRWGGEMGSPETVAAEIVKAAKPGYGQYPSVKAKLPSEKSSMFDRAFAQHLRQHDVILPEHQGKGSSKISEPANKSTIIKELDKSRASLTPSKVNTEHLACFKKINDQGTIATMSRDALPIVEGTYKGPDRAPPFKAQELNTLTHLTDGTLPPIMPQRAHGSPPAKLHQQLRKDFEHYVCPTIWENDGVVPNFFCELRESTANPDGLQRELGYNLTFGARAIHWLRGYSLGKGKEFDGRAYALGFTLQEGNLTLYAGRVRKNHAGDTGYVVTQLGSWVTSGTVDELRKGIKIYRNARDWADRMRQEVIEDANKQKAKG